VPWPGPGRVPAGRAESRAEVDMIATYANLFVYRVRASNLDGPRWREGAPRPPPSGLGEHALHPFGSGGGFLLPCTGAATGSGGGFLLA